MESVWFVAFLVFTLKVHQSQTQQVNYVKPHGNTTCPGDPCLTLEEYSKNSEIYFLSNVNFVFLSGVHNLNVSVRVTNVSAVHFEGEDLANQTVQILFSPLVNITFISCNNTTFSDLSFTLSGSQILYSPSEFFATIGFQNSSVHMSHIIFRGSRSVYFSTALFSYFSHIQINDIQVEKAKSVRGAALVAYNSTVKVYGNNIFNNNLAIYRGGVLFAQHSNITFYGSNNFRGNTALIYHGGAIFIKNTNITFSGEAHFIQNKAKRNGGAKALAHSRLTLTRGIFYFKENSAGAVGGVMLFHNSTALMTGKMIVQGNTAKSGAISVSTFSHVTISSNKALFINNTAIEGAAIALMDQSKVLLSGAKFNENYAFIFGGAMSIAQNCHVTIADTTFIGNRVEGIGGAISINSGFLQFKRTNHIENNWSKVGGGGMSIFNVSRIYFTGNNYFRNNTSNEFGGGFYAILTNISIQGSLNFINNQGRHGGAVHGIYSEFDCDYFSNVIFDGNKAAYKGGAASNTDATWNVKGSITFSNNSATIGGAMSLIGASKLILNTFSDITYRNNHADKTGGAIFFSDKISTNQCHTHDGDIAFCYSPNSTKQVQLQMCKRLSDCFLELNVSVPFNVSTSNVSIAFYDNFAGESGSVIFGGSLDNCRLYLGGGFQDGCGNKIGRYYTDNSLQVFLAISTISNMTSAISSEPFRVCFCDDGLPNCEMNATVATVRGKQFTLSAVTVGQGNYTVPSSIKADFNDSTCAQISALQRVQSTANTCTNISYRVFSNKTFVTLILFPDGPCRDTGIARREVKITFLSCPDGFVNIGSQCLCDERLDAFNVSCNVDKGTINRARNNFWVMGIYNNYSYHGLLLHQARCPFDFCMETEVDIHLEYSDIQCNHNHSGVICGSCRDNFSVALGNLHCFSCSNSYLLLILPFALAGVVLVAVLLILQLTVAHGTMNGLVFYANVVQVNRSIFFPPGITNVLTVFIAWLNLDLGIETCFYDGLDTYMFVWLQFLFPLYIWFLMGFIIVMSHYSRIIARSLGSNPVSVLATLLLLSYSKILRTIISTLSRTTVQSPNGSYQHVWLYDGNVPYFQRADHIVLGVFAIFALLIIFLPYTLLLLCGAWIHAYSHWKILSWINKIKPFMDAYYAPYKKGKRYWTGFLLLVRCALFLTFAFNTLGNASINLLTITSVTVGLTALAWLQKGLYENIHNDILEAVFILNLCILAAATYHVKEIEGSQILLVYISVGLAFVIFIGIIIYHIYLRIHKTSCWKRLLEINCQYYIVHTLGCKDKKSDTRNEAFKQIENASRQDIVTIQSPTTVTIDLHESLLEYY